ncbi:hypothetical protein TYRP_022946 [Tyrophagus putrescentiae]|nr:hypothetical protein TYRP_022946 [Tyrophagus putrescentiae]
MLNVRSMAITPVEKGNRSNNAERCDSINNKSKLYMRGTKNSSQKVEVKVKEINNKQLEITKFTNLKE